MLLEKNVISNDLCDQIKGLGSLRNILIYQYVQVDLDMFLIVFIKA